MKEKTIVFTFVRVNDTRPNFRCRTKSRLADEEDKEIELNGIDFRFYMNRLSRKYNERNIEVLFGYKD